MGDLMDELLCIKRMKKLIASLRACDLICSYFFKRIFFSAFHFFIVWVVENGVLIRQAENTNCEYAPLPRR